MIKATTEVLNLIGASLLVLVFSLYLWNFFATRGREKRRDAMWDKHHGEMVEEHRKFRERMLGIHATPPPPPPEN